MAQALDKLTIKGFKSIRCLEDFELTKLNILIGGNGAGATVPRLFGSVARGEEHSHSDVDILITLNPERTLLDIIAIKQDLEDLLGCSVDVMTEAALSPYIRERVLQEAVKLSR
jgi:hypothetical protein